MSNKSGSFQTYKAKNKQEKNLKDMVGIMGTDILEIDTKTGKILLSVENENDMQALKQTKIKAFNLLSKIDFVYINNVWEPKRDALIKVLSSLPISYT